MHQVILTRSIATIIRSFICILVLTFASLVFAAVTTRVSIANDGTQGYNTSSNAVISANGRYIAFISAASTLVPKDTNNAWDVFVHDFQANTTERISANSSGTQGDDDSGSDGTYRGIAISADGRFVAFSSKSANLVSSDTNQRWDIFVRDRQLKTTERVSIPIATNGTEANGHSFNPGISADGRYVVFQSEANNLVPNDTNGATDIFVRDRQLKTTTRVSVDSYGVQSRDNAGSYNPVISADGQLVAFESDARYLVTGDNNDRRDIFTHNCQTEETQLVSADSNGNPSNGDSWSAAISADGKVVAFTSNANNLVGDTNQGDDIFAHSLVTGVTERVSVAGSGLQANGTSRHPSLSGDGRFVAFASDANNLVPGDTNNREDIFVFDRLTHGITRVDLASDGVQQANDSSDCPAISTDGRWVAYHSYADNLVPGDTNNCWDVFVHDAGVLSNYQPDLWIRNAGETEYVGNNSYTVDTQTVGRAVDRGKTAVYQLQLQNDGAKLDSFKVTSPAPPPGWIAHFFSAQSGGTDITTQVTGTGWLTSALAAGSAIAFRVEVTPGTTLAYGLQKNVDVTVLSVGDANRKDIVRATTTVAAVPGTNTLRMSIANDGTQGNDTSVNSAISANGQYVAFVSNANSLVAGDTNSSWDVFVRNRLTLTTERVSLNSNGVQGDDDSGSDGTYRGIAISADGRFVAFSSKAANLVPGDTNQRWDIFVRDRQLNTTERVSIHTDGTEANGNSYNPGISADGRYVVFQSEASNLVVSDTNGATDIFVHDRQTGETTRVSVDSYGVQSRDNAGSYNPVISADGQLVAFESDARYLVTGDNNDRRDIFTHNCQTGETQLVSADSNGNPSNSDSWSAAISADGKVVAFTSNANNLDMLTGDTNQCDDIFVHSFVIGDTKRVSVSGSGLQANGGSRHPSLSGDGRFVAFASDANNLLPNDTNNRSDIFVFDRLTKGIKRVNLASDGVQQANDSSDCPAISTDGRWVAYHSYADNLVPGDTNNCWDVFVHDIGASTSYQPDLQIHNNGETAFAGVGIFNLDGTNQTKSQSVSANTSATYIVQVSNAGNTADAFNITLPGGGSGWTVKYTDLQSGNAITTPSWATSSIAPGVSKGFRVLVTPNTSVFPTMSYILLFGVVSATDSTKHDAVKAITTVAANYQPDVLVCNYGDSAYCGAGIYNLDGTGQTKSQTVLTGIKTVYLFQVKNAGNTVDTFTLTCPSPGTGWTLQIVDQSTGKDVTTSFIGTGVKVALAAGKIVSYTLNLTPGTAAVGTKMLAISAVSAADGAKKDIVKVVTTVITTIRQPDLLIRTMSDLTYTGANIFNLDGTNQTKSQIAPGGVTACYLFRIQNAGNTTDSFTIKGPGSSSGWAVTYFDLATCAAITSAMTGTGWSTGPLAPKAYKGFFVQVTPGLTVQPNTLNSLLVVAVSVGDALKKDAVKAITTGGGDVAALKLR